MQLKLQAKQLENEAKRLMKDAAKEKTKAKAALKKGNRAAAQLYAQNAVRFEQQAQQILQSCATTTGFATDLRSGVVSANMAKNMSLATTGLEQTVQSVDLKKVADQKIKMDSLKQKMGAAHELITNGEGELEVSSGAEDLLLALEDENAEDAMLQIGDIPMGMPVQPAPSIPTKGLKN